MNTDGQLKISKQLEAEIARETDPNVIIAKLHQAALASGQTLASNWEQNPQSVATADFARDHGAVEDRLRNERGQFVSQPHQDRTFSKTVTINGRQLTFEADSELQLERDIHQANQIGAAFAESQESETYVPELPAAEREQLNEATRLNLEIQWKNGQISTSDYLERSGAIHEYLESQGVPLTQLRETVEQNESARFEKSWAEAAEIFRNNHSDWPGGEKNKEMLGLTIQSLGLMDATDKAAALAQAYHTMREKGLVFDGVAETENKQAERVNQQVAKALQDASPIEILAAYKDGLGVNDNVAKGDDAFIRNFSRSGSGIFGR